jgi:uncharacterized protein
VDLYSGSELWVQAAVAILRQDVYDTAMRQRYAPKIITMLLFALVFFLMAPVLRATQEVFPKPIRAINDFAGVIPDKYATSMENIATEILAKTQTSLVVATMPTIGDNEFNDYVNRLYQAWGIGKKGEDKGVLIFLAINERKIRIETGYGVEGILPDGLTGEILDRYAIPSFKAGDYGKGLYETLIGVATVIASDANVSIGEKVPPQRTENTRNEPGIGSYIILFLAIAFLLGTRQGRAMLPWILLLLLSGGGSRRGGGGSFGGFGGGFGGFGGGMSGGGGSSRGF